VHFTALRQEGPSQRIFQKPTLVEFGLIGNLLQKDKFSRCPAEVPQSYIHTYIPSQKTLAGSRGERRAEFATQRNYKSKCRCQPPPFHTPHCLFEPQPGGGGGTHAVGHHLRHSIMCISQPQPHNHDGTYAQRRGGRAGPERCHGRGARRQRGMLAGGRTPAGAHAPPRQGTLQHAPLPNSSIAPSGSGTGRAAPLVLASDRALLAPPRLRHLVHWGTPVHLPHAWLDDDRRHHGYSRPLCSGFLSC